MKLLLTSAGLLNPKIAEKFIELVSDKNSKILMVAYSQSDEELFYINESKRELTELGFDNIEVVNLDQDININKLGKCDVIYVCGGNTYSILDRLKRSGLDKYIIDQVNKDSVYVGVSAGSIIAGKSIEIAGWGSEGDTNETKLEDLSGFSFIDTVVFPHFKDSLKDEVKEFRRKVNYPVRELTDNQALLIIDGKEKFIE